MNQRRCVPGTAEIQHSTVMKFDFPAAKAAAEMKTIGKRLEFRCCSAALLLGNSPCCCWNARVSQ